MSRINDINALLDRAESLLPKMEKDYNNSLHAKTISNDLKIDIKDFVGHLRSVLDYLAHDIRDKYCPLANSDDDLYFPIRDNRTKFDNYINRAYPELEANCPALYNYLESIQIYNGNNWLSHFNDLNNKNKHEKLVEQSRSETERINVEIKGGGSISWNPTAVKFGSGVFIGGVPVNPQTQMPQPSSSQIVTRQIWVDFKFEGINISALTLLKESLKGIKEIVKESTKHL
jgi:hypothetical protein